MLKKWIVMVLLEKFWRVGINSNPKHILVLTPSPAVPKPSYKGWQYGTVRSEFAYYVPRILNRTVPAYLSLIFEAYCTYLPHFGTVRFFAYLPLINLVK